MMVMMNDKLELMMCFTQIDFWDQSVCVHSKSSCSALWEIAAHIREAYGMVNHHDTSAIVPPGTVCGHQ